MNDRDIDEVLKRAADAAPDVDPALLNRILGSMHASLRAVRPLPSSTILQTSLVLIAVAVAVAGATLLGLRAIPKMNTFQIGLIFSLLGVMVWLAAAISVAEMIPGSRSPAGTGTFAVTGCVTLGLVFASLFHDYSTGQFVRQGMVCLTAGLAHAIPTYIASWWILSRGFAVNTAASCFAKGVLGGLAGIVMLELHCPNLQAPHVIVWHVAVIPVSGALGALTAWIQARRARCSTVE